MSIISHPVLAIVDIQDKTSLFESSLAPLCYLIKTQSRNTLQLFLLVKKLLLLFILVSLSRPRTAVIF